jgi:hypothetical protein
MDIPRSSVRREDDVEDVGEMLVDRREAEATSQDGCYAGARAVPG